MVMRLQDIFTGQQAYDRGRTAPTLNPTYGGQFGFSPDYANYLSNSAYIRKNVICRLISAPAGFNLLPEGQLWIQTLKSIVELHSQTIDGLQQTLSVNFNPTPFGQSGEMQDDLTQVQRSPSDVTMTFPEKYGRPFSKFFFNWIEELLMHEQTGYPNIVTRLGQGVLTDLLPDIRAATMIFIEPDPTLQFVDKSWLITNMMPKTSGDIVGRKDMTAPGDAVSLSVGFTGIGMIGVGVDQFAQMLLSQMSLVGANPNLRPSYIQAIDPDVSAAAQGWAENLATQEASAISV